MDSVPLSREAASGTRRWCLFILHIPESSSLERRNFYLHVWKQEFARQFDGFSIWRLSVVSQREPEPDPKLAPHQLNCVGLWCPGGTLKRDDPQTT